MSRPAIKRKGSPPLPPSSAVPSSSTLTSIRSTESTNPLDRGGYLKKRPIDEITYRQGCPTDKHSDATVRDEDPIAEKSSYASRDGCEVASSKSSLAAASPSKDNQEAAPLYVIQKKGVDRRSSHVTKVSQAYSFEDYWSILDSVVEGCRCISIAGACTTVPSTSFGSSNDEDDVTGTNSYGSGIGPYPQPNAHSTSSTSSNYYNIPKTSPTSSAANVNPDTFNASTNTILEASSIHRGGRKSGPNSRLTLLRDLERELSDDEDFRPAHRTSACFVLHEKDKVNDIFR